MAEIRIAKIVEGGVCVCRSLSIVHKDTDFRIGVFRWPWVYRTDWHRTLLGQIVDSGLSGTVEWLCCLRQKKNAWHIRVLCLGFGAKKISR